MAVNRIALGSSLCSTAIVKRVAVAAACGLALSTPASAQSYFSVIDLGGDGAVAVNNAGQVVGNDGSSAFSWTASGGRIRLGTLGGSYSYAYDVNDVGQVVGYSETATGSYHAFSWTAAGGMIDLGTLGGDSSVAFSVNDAGQVVGESFAGDLSCHAFSWTGAGVMIDIGTIETCNQYPPTVNNAGQVVVNRYGRASVWTVSEGIRDLGTLGGGFSAAYAINSAGQVVGDSTTASGQVNAFSWTAAGGMIDLGSLDGVGSQAVAVNDAGQVVGNSGTSGGSSYHAFSWTEAAGMIDLGTLGGPNSQAFAVNDAGQVVGSSTASPGDSPPSYAFSWTAAGGMTGLGTAADQSEAVAVNDAGQVVGHEGFRALLWNPVPSITVAIDIKPGGSPNTVNLGSNGSTAVAILSTRTFNALDVNPATVTLAGAAVRLQGNGSPQSSLQDVNEDGLVDLVVHVNTDALELSPAERQAILKGRTFAGVVLRGADSIRIVK